MRITLKQPDGRWCCFSTIVDAFIYQDATKDQVVNFARKEAADEAEEEIRKVIEHVEKTGRSYPTGSYDYDEVRRIDATTRRRERREKGAKR